MSSIKDFLDPYHYARDHDAGPGMWCVYGPGDFKMTVPGLQKSVAFIIGKLLSKDYAAAKQMLDDLMPDDGKTDP
jgi:hypothetical protein